MLTRREIEDAAAERGGYHKRTFVEVANAGLTEIVGTHVQERTTYSRTGIVKKAGTVSFIGRRWKKSRQCWAKTRFTFTDAGIISMVSGWTVAILEARAALKRQAKEVK